MASHRGAASGPSPSSSVAAGLDDVSAFGPSPSGAQAGGAAGGGGGTSTAAFFRVAWKKDEAVNECERCSKPFKFYRRRHHCRRCGGIFCADCANEKTAGISGWSGPERVCKICSSIPTTLRPQSHSRERRVVMLGAQGVGKTTLHNVFVAGRTEAAGGGGGAAAGQQSWEPLTTTTNTVTGLPTAQCAGRKYHHRSGVDYHILLQDTIGQPQFGLFQAALAVGTHAFLLVFSADERSSMNALKSVREKIFDCGGLFQPCIVVCTTRGEQAVRSVQQDEGQLAAEEMLATRYIEVNLSSEAEVNSLFERVLDEIYARDSIA